MKRKGEEVRESPAYAPAKVAKGRVPRLRFPEFRKAGEWEERKLMDIFDYYSTANNPRSDFSEGGDIAYIHYGDIHTKFSNRLDFQKKVIPRIAKEFVRNATLLENGDLILADASEDTEGIGKAVEVFGLERGAKAVAGLHTILLRDRERAYVDGFSGLLQYISNVHRQFVKLAVGVKVYSITKSALYGVSVPVPTHAEQRKIAACLSSLDELIAAHDKKLEALKAYKKGLMQKLFPAEGEVRPRLRFPEFRKAGEWEEKPLGSLSAIVRGGSPRPIEAYLTTAPEGLNWLKIGDLDQESKYVTATKEKVLPSAMKKTREVIPGDLILSNSMSFGRPYILKIKTCIHDGWIAVSKIVIDVDTEFLYYTILSDSCQKYFNDNAAGAVVQNLNADIIKLLPITLPSLPEQRKIAATLSSLDSLLAAQGRKLEALREHKRGLIQGLFPRAEEE